MLGKAELLDAITGKNRGILATPTDRKAIQAAIARLEDLNPNPDPFSVPERLEGNWRLLYTTSNDLLRLDQLPFCKLGQIYQYIQLEGDRIYNVAEVKGLPYLDGVVSVAARFEPVSKQRVNVRFERSVVGLQSLLSYQSPSQFIEMMQTGKKLPALDFSIDPTNQKGWLDITYLDDDLRIGRGNVGSLFVLTRAK
jgi:hypothetical protein